MKRLHLPWPRHAEKSAPAGKTPPDKTDKTLAKKKHAYIIEISYEEKRLVELQQAALQKRALGYNTTEAEAALKAIVGAIHAAKDLIYWTETQQGLDAVVLKINEIRLLEEKAKRLIAQAPLFGDKPKADKTTRKYLDDRDWVREALQMEPGKVNKQTRGMFNAAFNIFSATATVQSSRCWDTRANTYRLENPPSVESWYFPKIRKIAIFMETNSTVDRFMDRNDLDAATRDSLLAELCEKQVYGGGYRLVYFGDPITDANSILEQLFTGQGRLAGMFGLEALERIAKATAALPNLSIASIAFNTEIHPLNQLQQERFDGFMKALMEYDPELLGVLGLARGIQEARDFTEVKKKLLEHPWPTTTPDAKKRLETCVRLVENAAKIVREGGKLDKVRGGVIEDLWKIQTPETRKRRDAAQKIFRWQRTLHPSKQDTKELAGRFPPDEASALKTSLEQFASTLEKLSDKFGDIQKDLRKYRIEYPETQFKEGSSIAVFFLVDGVRFEEKTLSGGQTVELPDLSLKITVEIRKGKKDPPSFYKDYDVNITAANQYIDEVRELRRLASFGIKFPQSLPRGTYTITFVVTDNIRSQAARASVEWAVIAPDSAKK